jgi:hypothetical protein
LMGYFCQRPSDREPGLHVVLVSLPYLPPVQRHPALLERVIPKIERPVWTGPVMEPAEVLQPIISPLPGGLPLR